MQSCDGFPFKFDEFRCMACNGDCCIGESGYIWINLDEFNSLVNFLDMRADDVAQKYIKKVGYKYSLREVQIGENNYACIFFDLEKKRCSIYEVRPSQCRTFPFWEQFKENVEEVRKECPAII